MHDDQGLKQEEGGGGKEEILEKGDRQDAWNLQIWHLDRDDDDEGKDVVS